MNYLPGFEKLIAELKNNSKINLTRYLVSAPAAETEINAVEQTLRIDLPSDMKQFYREMNGFILEWNIIDFDPASTDQTNSGCINILPISQVFKSWKGVTWFDGENGDVYKAVKPFDFFQPEACSAFLIHNEKCVAPTIYYHYLGETLYDTGYEFSGYIQRLLAAKGFFYWLESLCVECQGTPQTQQFFEAMPNLFDNFNRRIFIPGNPSEKY